MSALSFSIPQTQAARRLRLMLLYNLGRIASYSLIGALGGWLGYQLSAGPGLGILRTIAGILLIMMGLYLANWWHGLSYLERGGAVLWRKVQPLGQKLMPVKSASSAFALGALWGWLPCGLVYTALAYGIAQGNTISSAGVMFAFGLGTLPALMTAGVMAERLKMLLQRQGFRVITALLIMVFGVWTIWGASGHSGHSQHGADSATALPMDHSAHMDHDESEAAGKQDDQAEIHQHHH